MSEPNYRIRVEIYDDEVGEVVAREDQPLIGSDEEKAANVYRALRQFNREKEAHESTHYFEGVEE